MSVHFTPPRPEISESVVTAWRLNRLSADERAILIRDDERLLRYWQCEGKPLQRLAERQRAAAGRRSL